MRTCVRDVRGRSGRCHGGGARASTHRQTSNGPVLPRRDEDRVDEGGGHHHSVLTSSSPTRASIGWVRFPHAGSDRRAAPASILRLRTRISATRGLAAGVTPKKVTFLPGCTSLNCGLVVGAGYALVVESSSVTTLDLVRLSDGQIQTLSAITTPGVYSEDFIGSILVANGSVLLYWANGLGVSAGFQRISDRLVAHREVVRRVNIYVIQNGFVLSVAVRSCRSSVQVDRHVVEAHVVGACRRGAHHA